MAQVLNVNVTQWLNTHELALLEANDANSDFAATIRQFFCNYFTLFLKHILKLLVILRDNVFCQWFVVISCLSSIGIN